MQSQLAAALMGQSSTCSSTVTTATVSIANVPSTSTTEDDDKDTVEDEADEIEDDIDEEYESESGVRSGKVSTAPTGRTITLQMLLDANILQPGTGTMSIEYLGQKFTGDLLADGKIKSQETDQIFASPSAWAIHCKRIINPDKKSGCGWASVKYKGRKLDAYKNTWFKKKKEQQQDRDDEADAVQNQFIMLREFSHQFWLSKDMEADGDSKLMAAPAPIQRVVMKHNTVPNRTFTHDGNMLIECVPFSMMGKIQPFLVSMSTNAVLLMDFHCHLTMSEVSGYLAGQWDVNAHNLAVTHAFPCRNTKADRDLGSQVETEISEKIEKEQLTLVGWYHSHPTAAATPTLRDVDSQLEYQIRMKGNSDSSYSPCVGVICSPYNIENTSLESSIISYWVVPPPENKPNEYGRPMLMSYSVVQDSTLTPSVMDEMKKCAEYYKKEKDFIKFSDKYTPTATYLDKLKTTLTSKFPRDNSDGVLWGFIRELIGCPGEEKVDTSVLLSVPVVPTSKSITSPLPPITSSTTLTPNLMLTSDIANVLFSSGKFPSALLGIPDPMARSTLAANNMFLSPSLFKMQDTLNLLKPMTTSSPIPGTSKSAELNLGTPIKIPSDISLSKPPKIDFSSPDLTSSLKTPKIDYPTPEFNSNKPKIDFSASDLSISSVKPSFTVSDLSISSVKSSSDVFSQMLDMSVKGKSDFSVADLTGPPSKMPRMDFTSTLDLSMPAPKSASTDLETAPSDLSASDQQPLELSINKSAGPEQMQPISLTVSSEN